MLTSILKPEMQEDSQKIKVLNYKTLSVPQIKGLCYKSSLLWGNSKAFLIEKANKGRWVWNISKRLSMPSNVFRKIYDYAYVFSLILNTLADN